MARRSIPSMTITVFCFISLLAAGSCPGPGTMAPMEAGKETAKTLAKEALGPAGTVVDVGEAVLSSGVTIAGAKMQRDADEALLATMEDSTPEKERRADFLNAKANCFLRKDCKRWYELTSDPYKSSGGSH